METNARYLTIGCFALAAIVACLGFVFWLNRTGGLGQQEVYQVRFGNEVSGLQTGAAVLFDGMRVGSVSALKLDPQDPRHVIASLAVTAGTPVRQDTTVGIASQGLMGTVAVSLQGGHPAAALAKADNGGPPMLVADPAAGRSLTQSAQETLGRVDGILGDNAEGLKATIANLKVFSDALARNSGRVDAVLAGLAQLAGGGPVKLPPPVYDLKAPTLSGLPSPLPPGQIVILMPTAVVAFQTQHLLTRSPEGQLLPVGEMQWSDALPGLLQQKVMEAFEDAKFSATLTPPTNFGPNDRQLQLDLRRFDIATGADRRAAVSFSAKLLSADGHVLRTQMFEAKTPVATADDPAAVKGLATAFDAAVVDLGRWVGELPVVDPDGAANSIRSPQAPEVPQVAR